MLRYYDDLTAINIEMTILSGGTNVTGRDPFVMIWNADKNYYFDFVSRGFTGFPGNTAELLLSALDGVYRYSWDISGLGSKHAPKKGMNLTFEYYDATAIDLEEVIIEPRPNLNVSVGGGGTQVVGVWNGKQKKRLFDLLKDIKKDIKDSDERIMFLLKRIVSKKTLRKEDIEFIKDIQEGNKTMWQEFLKIMKLNEGATTNELLVAIEEYYKAEDKASKEVKERLKKMTESLKPKPEDDEDDD